jgi:hypothetical protein
MIVQVLGAMADHTCYIWFSLGQPYKEIEVLDALTTVWARARHRGFRGMAAGGSLILCVIPVW